VRGAITFLAQHESYHVGQIALLPLFLLAVGYARWTGHWHTVLPDELLFDLIQHASEFGHPGM
jgi:hypothetical protein